MMNLESPTAGKKARRATATIPAQRAVMKDETFSTRAINALKKISIKHYIRESQCNSRSSESDSYPYSTFFRIMDGNEVKT